MLEIHSFEARIAHVNMRFSFPAVAKCLRVNIRPGEIANQRHLTGQANRIIEGFQDSPNLNMVEARVELDAWTGGAGVKRAGQRHLSVGQFPLQLGNIQQSGLIRHLRRNLGKVHSPPAN
ncbi:Uncharacterised protein [Salmonella enterica subsp. enterica]|nr:Uncharacterised protein [Salmonella enterica subsp. enterica]